MKKISLAIVALLLFSSIVVVRGHSAQKPTQPEWQTKWNKTLAAAKKEGSVTLYTIWAPTIRIGLAKAFKEKYGIDLEIVAFSRGSDQVAKIKAEQGTGIFQADVFGSGESTFATMMKPAGLIGNIEQLLILPEVKDPKYWMNDRFPWFDRDKTVIAQMFSKQSDIVYNTNLVKEGEISTYKDLLKPQYKGKITMTDPSISGVANALMRNLAFNVWDADRAKEFLRQLLVQQKLVIQRDPRIHVEWVARGKYPIGLAVRNPNLVDLLNAGAPLGIVDIKDAAIQATPGSSCMAVPNRSPHPNAAAVFVNWLLTKEGQSIFAKTYGSPSLRKDASTEGILPFFLAKPGEKLFVATEEFATTGGEWGKIAKQIMKESDM